MFIFVAGRIVFTFYNYGEYRREGERERQGERQGERERPTDPAWDTGNNEGHAVVISVT